MSASILKIKNVGLCRDGRWTLRFINWEIKEGERWAMMGLNGSGKTTLMQILTGYLWPMEGEIELFGHSLGSYDIRELRKHIGYAGSAISEMFHPDDTVYEIVAGGMEATIGLFNPLNQMDEDRVDSLLKRFALGHLKSSAFRQLSQGERQRVALARALALKPRLLVMDEPCSGLDFVQREFFLALLGEYIAEEVNLALIYITHRSEEIIPEIQRAIFLKDGMLFGKGSREELLSAPHLSLLYGQQIATEYSGGRCWVRS